MDTQNPTENPTENKDTPSSGTGYEEKVQVDDKPVEGTEKQYDDLGYEIVPKEESKKAEPEEKPEEKDEQEIVEDPSTGYGDAPEKEGKEKEPPKEAPAEETKEKDDEEQVQVDLGDVKGLLPFEIEGIKKLASEHKLSPEVTKALVQYKKEEAARLDKALKDKEENLAQQEIETKKKWMQELKSDPTFGGESFGKNVMKVERLLKDFMPEIKKELTSAGIMLPPYIMRDFYKVSEKLYGTKQFVQGEAPEKEEDKTDDPLDYYT